MTQIDDVAVAGGLQFDVDGIPVSEDKLSDAETAPASFGAGVAPDGGTQARGAEAKVPAKPARRGRKPGAGSGGRKQVGLPDDAIAAAAPVPVVASKPVTKGQTVLDLLRREGGAAISEMVAATGWQAHSVRGFLSGNVGKKLGLKLVSDVGDGGVRRYRIADAG